MRQSLLDDGGVRIRTPNEFESIALVHTVPVLT